MKGYLLLTSFVLFITIPAKATEPCEDGLFVRTKKYTMTWQGYQRTYLVHTPPASKIKGALPLLFNIHGGGGTARGNVKLTFGRFDRLADQDGFIVVYPNALEKNWNDGRKSSYVTEWQKDIDDVGFIVAIIDDLKKKYTIDEERIFTTGMSNGGFMSSRLICDKAEIFRGAAILTATLSSDYLPSCKPSKPVAVLVMNGTADKLVPYDGGQVMVLRKPRGNIIATVALMKFWEEQNGCTERKQDVELPDTSNDGTTVTRIEYGNCKDRGALVLYKINGGGHTWPGGKQYLGRFIIGNTSRDIVACDVIWNFFKSL